jgi:general secretion pathway protein J
MTTLHKLKAGGFTLLELLIALAIFGLLSVMSYSGLRSVMEQQAHTEAAATRLGELHKIYLIMQRDVEQMVPRAVRGEYGDELPPLAGDDGLQFTRGGWSNPLGRPRSTLQRVGYAFEDRQLVRYTWSVLDRAQDSVPLTQPLTAAVRRMSVRFLADDNEWETGWPVEDAAAGSQASVDSDAAIAAETLPRVLEITLEHEHYGLLVWLFQLPS